ncbi:MAG: phosphate ABC transporter permease subunit PstC [Anaerolineaceae bacterium]
MQNKLQVDKAVRTVLLISASLSIVIVISIFIFIFRSSLPAFKEFGVQGLLGELTWRPANGSFGILAMIVGSVMVTLMALVIGVPLAIAAAIFLAEIAPRGVQAVVRPAVQLLAGIPSVVYGLFGMVVLVPLIRRIPVAGNSGYGLLSAAIVLAVMILPTITSISEDAIRAVPRAYTEASLALGATHLQTIFQVLLPAGKSGIVAALILGIGRALGETMAMIMVIGNSVILPAPLDDNPLTVFLSQARTLTGNIAVEINYASGLHASALFATGVVLFVLIMVVNVSAHAILNRSNSSVG